MIFLYFCFFLIIFCSLERTMTEKNTLNNVSKIEIQNANREEIKQLKSELIQKNDELQQLKNTENNCLIEANEFKEMQNRLMCRIKYLEDELALHKNKDQPNGYLNFCNNSLVI